MLNRLGRKIAVFCIQTFISGLCIVSAVWSQGPSYNVPLEHPVYAVIDMLPLPVVAGSVWLSNRPYTRQQVCTLLAYAKEKGLCRDKNILGRYLEEFRDTDEKSVKKIDVPIDGKNTHAYPYLVTGVHIQDSGFSKAGFSALGLDALSSSVEVCNKTVMGGRLYSNINGLLSYFDGAIITEYSSKEQWKKINDPRIGRNYTTIMAEDNQLGNFIGYDDVTAYVKLPVKRYDIMFGFDRLSWGYAGASGLFFSGEGRPFLMAKATTTFGKLNYTFILGKLTSDFYDWNRVIYAKHITYSPVQWFAIGLSDAIISVDNGLKAPYFLPFVPYYFIEHYIGGQDNRIMAFDAKCAIRQNVSFYGELYIDEMTNLLGFVTNKKANDIWAGLFGIKWHNPVPAFGASLLKAEFVQLEPWVYTRYSYAEKMPSNNPDDVESWDYSPSSQSRKMWSNNPVNFGHPIGNQMGPHSRNISLTFSGMLSEKISGSLGVSQYLKGAGPGSDILSGNDMITEMANGVPIGHQIYSNKDYRFKNFSRDRIEISASSAYTFEHWLMAEISGDFVQEQGPVKGNYFRAGLNVRINY